MNTYYSLSHLSNAALLRHDESVHARGRAATADELASLGEIDARKLYLPAGHPSMHSWCVHVRHMSEDSASRRIQAARLARRFPGLLPMVADGRLHLAAILLLDPHLAPETADELLALATHRSKRELERVLAERFPKADLPAQVTPLPAVLAAGPESVSAPVRMPFCDFVKPESAPARVAPLSGTTYGIQYTFDQEDYDLLQYAKALLSHRVPSGNVREISRLALVALVEKTERQMFGVGRRRRRGQRAGTHPRHIPLAVKQAVWRRDGGRCTFVGENGVRCPARERLQFDHIEPVGRDGDSSPGNLRLLCAAHNQFEADRVYGSAFMDGKREAARATPRQTVDPAREPRGALAPVGAPRAMEEVPVGTATPEPAGDRQVIADAVAALRSLGYRERDAREAVARCGLAPGATLEQQVRAALSYRVRPLLLQSARIQAAQMSAAPMDVAPAPH